MTRHIPIRTLVKRLPYIDAERKAGNIDAATVYLDVVDRLNALPDKQKTIMYLRYGDGRPVKDVASLLNIKEKAVDFIVTTAFKALTKENAE